MGSFGTWQSRNASGKLAALPPIADGDLNPAISSGNFAAMEAQTMGTLGTPSDGFYLDYNPMLAAQADDPKLIAGFDGDIAAASFKPGMIQVTQFNPISAGIPRASALGVVTMNNVDNTLAGKVHPPGGGGGGTVGGGPPGDCAPGGPPLAQSPQPGDFGNYTVPSSNVRVMNPRKLNDSPVQQWYISSLSTPTAAILLHGDTAVWSVAVTPQRPEGTGPPLYYVTLTANTHKAGHFGAVVGVTVQGEKQQLYGAVVDIGGCKSSGSSDVVSAAAASTPFLAVQRSIPTTGAKVK